MLSTAYVLDDSISEFERMKQIFPGCKYSDLFTKNYLKFFYTSDILSQFLDVPIHTKTNMYTILKRVRLYIDNNGLCVNGVIKPDDKLGSILSPTYKYNRIIHNNLSKYINLEHLTTALT
jgi:hypothetical protein